MENKPVALKRKAVNRYSRDAWESTPYALKYVQAKTMLDQGKTYDHITAVTGMSSATIAKVSKGEIEISPAWLKPVKSLESAKLTTIIHQLLDSITPEKLAATPTYQLTTSAAILIDKRRLIDGESTANILHADLIGTLADDRAKLLHQLEELR